MEGSIEVLHRVARATVTVAADIGAEHRSVAVLGNSRLGTGCVIDGDGHVLTVNYVVIGAEALTVVDVNGRTCSAELVAQDFDSGVAVVRMDEPASVAPVPAGDCAALTPGESVFLIASAGHDERRCAAGALTGLDAFDASWEYRLERAIWMTCSNPGLGGGPVCNRFGQIIGIASLNLGAIGRSTLAIPAEHFFLHADELLAHGRRISRQRRAWLGMFCYSLPGRAVIAGAIPGSPADEWGLRPGDVIASVDGDTVHARSDLYSRIWSRDPGDVLAIDVYRDGGTVTVSVRSTDVEEFFA